MAGKLLEIHPAALAELGSAVEWYLKRSEAAASELVAEVDRAIGRVIESPGRWPTGEQATHKFVLRRFPYAIIYRERETTCKSSPSLTDTDARGIGRTGCEQPMSTSSY